MDDEGRMTRSRAACPVPGWRRPDGFGEKKRIPAMLVPLLYVNRQNRVAARGYFIWGDQAVAAAAKVEVFYTFTPRCQDASRTRPAGSGNGLFVPLIERERHSGASRRIRRYFAAPAPAAAATPSCCPVPPLAPIAPMILPFTVMGTPPSEAIGGAGKVVKAVFPAANWSANILVGRRYMAAVRALPWEISADAIWVPSIFSK